MCHKACTIKGKQPHNPEQRVLIMAVWIRVHPAWRLLTIHSRIYIPLMETLGRINPVIPASNIRHKDFHPSPSSALRLSRSGYSPWILKKKKKNQKIKVIDSFEKKSEFFSSLICNFFLYIFCWLLGLLSEKI